MVKNLTMQNFHEETDSGVCVIDFWAAWCGPCKMMSPVIDELADDMPGVKVYKVNVDQEEKLASAFGVMSIPTIALMRDGQVTTTAVGYMAKDALLRRLGL